MSKTDLAGVRARIETTAGPMTFEFFPDKAPGHVENFVKLAEKGFYDGTMFHRVLAGFMIQGGCPKGDGTGGPGYQIKAEFNDVHHGRGVLSMARSADPNSASSQFFIMHGDAPTLDNQYSAFGKVVSGMDAVDRIVQAPGKPIPGAGGNRPNSPQVIERAVVVKAPAEAAPYRQGK